MKTIFSPEARQAEQDEFFGCYFDEKISAIVEALLPHKKLILQEVTK